MVLDTYDELYPPIIGCRGFGCEDNLYEIVCPESFGGVILDLRYLLQGRMWALVLRMAYMSFFIGRRGFGGKDDLWEIICPESYGRVTFDLGPLHQGRMWSFISIMAYISLSITRGGFGCEDNIRNPVPESFGDVRIDLQPLL